MNTAVKSEMSAEQIISRIRRRVMKNNPTAYHIYVGDFSLYEAEQSGFIVTRARAKTKFSVDGTHEEKFALIDIGIDSRIK